MSRQLPVQNQKALDSFRVNRKFDDPRDRLEAVQRVCDSDATIVTGTVQRNSHAEPLVPGFEGIQGVLQH